MAADNYILRRQDRVEAICYEGHNLQEVLDFLKNTPTSLTRKVDGDGNPLYICFDNRRHLIAPDNDILPKGFFALREMDGRYRVMAAEDFNRIYVKEGMK